MDIYLNCLIQSHLNSTINLQVNALYRVLPTKCRSCRDHRLCDVTSPYWLRVPERNLLNVATYRALLHYLASSFTCVADMPHRRRLRSASTEQLDVPTCRRSTIGGRAFPVAGAKVWNGLPSMVPHHLTWCRHSRVSPTCRTGSGPPPLKDEVTSQSPWSRYNCHLVGIT